MAVDTVEVLAPGGNNGKAGHRSGGYFGGTNSLGIVVSETEGPMGERRGWVWHPATHMHSNYPLCRAPAQILQGIASLGIEPSRAWQAVSVCSSLKRRVGISKLKHDRRCPCPRVPAPPGCLVPDPHYWLIVSLQGPRFWTTGPTSRHQEGQLPRLVYTILLREGSRTEMAQYCWCLLRDFSTYMAVDCLCMHTRLGY